MFPILLKTKCILLLCFLTLLGFCQKHPTILSTGHSGTGSNINVTYHKCYWRVNPDSTVKYIKGFVQTNFVTIQNNVSSISFDLNTVLHVDSIIYHHSAIPKGNITHINNVLTINLGTILLQNTYDSVTIFYRGTPPSPKGAANGYTKSRDFVTNQNYITTLSESYEDKDWWPCKADMQDKIDSLDIYVNVPWSGADTFWVASNGQLLDSTIINNDRIFHFHTNYPIASYLVCLSVARYDRYYRGFISQNGQNIPIVYNIFRGKQPNQISSILSNMDQMVQVLTSFSSKWGDYPYPLDKFGFYEGVVNAGGMEHQTFSAIASYLLNDPTTLAHELTHQWFGDKVSFATWNDLWLAEGFAQYGEALACELVPSIGISSNSLMASYKSTALNLSTASTYIPNKYIVNSDSIWNSVYGQIVYNRGCMIVSMLRSLCGDSLFFKAISNYLSSPGLAYKTATTDSLKNHFNKVLGQDISPFFTDYVYGNGHPLYQLNCNNVGNNNLVVSISSQTQSSGSSVNYFRTPIVLEVKGINPNEDTLICFFDWGNGHLSYAGNGLSLPVSGNMLTYHFSFNPVSISLDPYSTTLVQGNSILAADILKFEVSHQKNGNMARLELNEALDARNIALERSEDGTKFYTLGIMNPENNIVPKVFHYLDEHPLSRENYYRAKYTNNFGTSFFSKVVKLTNTFNEEIVLDQNPVNDVLIITIQSQHTTANGKLLIHDLDGKMVGKYYNINQQKIKINTSGFHNGVYVISYYTTNDKVIHKTFFVEH